MNLAEVGCLARPMDHLQLVRLRVENIACLLRHQGGYGNIKSDWNNLCIFHELSLQVLSIKCS